MAATPTEMAKRPETISIQGHSLRFEAGFLTADLAGCAEGLPAGLLAFVPLVSLLTLPTCLAVSLDKRLKN